MKEIDYLKTKNFLALKWGTIKAYNFENNKEALALLNRYYQIGSSISAALQDDTDEQKEIVCKLIDLADTLYLSWEGKVVSRCEAKKYVNNYNSRIEIY